MTWITPSNASTLVNLDKTRADKGAALAPFLNAVSTKFEVLKHLEKGQESVLQAHLDSFIEHFPEKVSTKTDADGKFSISMPVAGKYVIAAKASRLVGDSEEVYAWIDSDVEVSIKESNVMLSNDNLATAPPKFNFTDFQIYKLPNPITEDPSIISQPTVYTFRDNVGNIIMPGTNDDTNTTTAKIWLSPPSTTVYPKDWVTTDGHHYKNVKVVSVEPDMVNITHADGGGLIPIATLPPDIKKLLNYDPVEAAKAAEQRVANDQATAAQEAAQQEALRQKQADDIAAQQAKANSDSQ